MEEYMVGIPMNKVEYFIRCRVQHYNPKKYWKLRKRVVEKNKYPKILKYIWLFYIKRCDAFNHASLGTHINHGAQFEEIPHFVHGLRGIIITHNAKIGKNVTIFQFTTIGEGKGGAPTIGDNVMIGPGAKILGGVHVGNNVNIGANAVIVTDVPDNTTVVVQKPRMIPWDESRINNTLRK